MTHHPFDEALHLEPSAQPGLSTGRTHPAYANMVGPFGGVTCAALLQGVLQHPARQGDPIALTVNYVAPVQDGPFELEVSVVRTNRSTQHWGMVMRQPGGVVASGTAVLALRRETWSAPEARPPEAAQGPEALPRAQLDDAPPWVRAYDMRVVHGGWPQPFDGIEQPDSRSVYWVRDEPPRPLDFPALSALADSFFPRIFMRRRQYLPIGTVSLTTYFHADTALLAAQGQRHLLASARALNFRHGYFDQTAELWSADGTLLASTHQIVYYRA